MVKLSERIRAFSPWSAALKRQLIKALPSTFAIILSAHIAIPLDPVPMTLQPTMISLLGFIHTQSVAACSVFLYLLLGAFGAPVFANSASGIMIFLGPTGGYLVGFLLCTAFIAHYASRYESFLTRYLICILGFGILLTCGVLHLSTFLGLKKAFLVGAVPFFIKDMISAALAVSLSKILKPRKRHF